MALCHVHNYFNSTMVRLKAVMQSSDPLLKLFQFHYGTIKRSGMAKPSSILDYFNSTMVRLKARLMSLS